MSDTYVSKIIIDDKTYDVGLPDEQYEELKEKLSNLQIALDSVDTKVKEAEKLHESYKSNYDTLKDEIESLKEDYAEDISRASYIAEAFVGELPSDNNINLSEITALSDKVSKLTNIGISATASDNKIDITITTPKTDVNGEINTSTEVVSIASQSIYREAYAAPDYSGSGTNYTYNISDINFIKSGDWVQLSGKITITVNKGKTFAKGAIEIPSFYSNVGNSFIPTTNSIIFSNDSGCVLTLKNTSSGGISIQHPEIKASTSAAKTVEYNFFGNYVANKIYVQKCYDEDKKLLATYQHLENPNDTTIYKYLDENGATTISSFFPVIKGYSYNTDSSSKNYYNGSLCSYQVGDYVHDDASILTGYDFNLYYAPNKYPVTINYYYKELKDGELVGTSKTVNGPNQKYNSSYYPDPIESFVGNCPLATKNEIVIVDGNNNINIYYSPALFPTKVVNSVAYKTGEDAEKNPTYTTIPMGTKAYRYSETYYGDTIAARDVLLNVDDMKGFYLSGISMNGTFTSFTEETNSSVLPGLKMLVQNETYSVDGPDLEFKWSEVSTNQSKDYEDIVKNVISVIYKPYYYLLKIVPCDSFTLKDKKYTANSPKDPIFVWVQYQNFDDVEEKVKFYNVDLRTIVENNGYTLTASPSARRMLSASKVAQANSIAISDLGNYHVVASGDAYEKTPSENHAYPEITNTIYITAKANV